MFLDRFVEKIKNILRLEFYPEVVPFMR